MRLLQDCPSQIDLSSIKNRIIYNEGKQTFKTWKEKCQAKMNCNIDFVRINGFCNINIEKPLLH